MQQPLIFILAGGEGFRLFPLTAHRSKPAIPFAGRYRLIDVAISNALKKNYQNIFALTQFKAKPLNDYIKKAYAGKVSTLTSCQDPYLGTADAIRKNLDLLENYPTDYVIILSADQLYSMDLDEMLNSSISKNAELTIATLPINEEEAKRMGVMKIDLTGKITDFIEKPKTLDLLEKFSLSSKHTGKIHSLNEKIFLGSMGIYIFKKSTLVSLLKNCKGNDFGMDIIPEQLKREKNFAYVFDGYWEDIGTIKSYYNANLKLLENKHSLNIFGEKMALITEETSLPPALIEDCLMKKTICADGCLIEAKEVSYSLLGMNTKVGKGSVLSGVLSLGSLDKNNETKIGENCYLQKVIIDENATIESGVCLSLNGETHLDADLGPVAIKDGIIIVKKGAVVPKNFLLKEERARFSA
jgi:glucose-1-phosphate adenylyltransferase